MQAVRARLVLVLSVLLAAAACGDDGGDGGPDRADVAAAVASCLERAGERVEPDAPIAQQIDLDVDVLAGELSGGGNVIVFVADDTTAAENAFPVIAQTLGSGADPDDFFRVGQVVVLFGEQAQAAQQQLLRECATEVP